MHINILHSIHFASQFVAALKLQNDRQPQKQRAASYLVFDVGTLKSWGLAEGRPENNNAIKEEIWEDGGMWRMGGSNLLQMTDDCHTHNVKCAWKSYKVMFMSLFREIVTTKAEERMWNTQPHLHETEWEALLIEYRLVQLFGFSFSWLFRFLCM